jgi:hypothetical protein
MKGKTEPPLEGQDSARRFASFTKRIMSVPKAEIQEKSRPPAKKHGRRQKREK